MPSDQYAWDLVREVVDHQMVEVGGNKHLREVGGDGGLVAGVQRLRRGDLALTSRLIPDIEDALGLRRLSLKFMAHLRLADFYELENSAEVEAIVRSYERSAMRDAARRTDDDQSHGRRLAEAQNVDAETGDVSRE